ncbi:Kinesin-associated protein 3 [Cichlidogyrus casuarinus]|uniref:Kinesin-associated protein 3 n=1 Tax=Cichlidogyrus casuarinus TaxID=1844966 RepID=A0ABD2PZB3_9PLAT
MAFSEDAKFLKKRVKAGTIDVHPSEKALVVYYETEAVILGEAGNPMIKNLSEDTDIKELARRIIDNCKLINPSKQPEVEHLLKFLLKRKEPEFTPKAKIKQINTLEDPGAFDSTEINETAALTDIEEYLEMLYEDVPEKLRSSALILQLARNPDNLEELYKNETLICALARVVQEDWKKSTDLATNIVYTFFCFSSFSSFHSIVTHFKIGALCMAIIEHEQKKYILWMEELQTKRKNLDLKNDQMKADYESSKKKCDLLVRKQEQFFRVAFYLLLNISESTPLEAKMANKGICTLLINCLGRNNAELLILVVSFLKKLSIFKENVETMTKSGIVDKMVPLLQSKKDDVISILLRLFYNLCFDQKFRLLAVKNGFLEMITRFITDEMHQGIALYVLYQFSLDPESRPQFVKTHALSILTKMVLASQGNVNLDMSAILVNLACDASNAKAIGDNQGLKALITRALQNKDELLMKIIRNLALSKDVAKRLVAEESGEGFKLEILGLLANLNLKNLNFCLVLTDLGLLSWIEQQLEIFLVAKATNQSLEQAVLVQKFQLTPEQAEAYSSTDDLLLETLRLIATCSFDPSVVKLILNSGNGIISLLIKLINGKLTKFTLTDCSAKQEDDAIVGQIIYTFYLLIYPKETRQQVISDTRQ